jgi:hypothetical protein
MLSSKRRLLRKFPHCKENHEWTDWSPEPYGDGLMKFCRKCPKTMNVKQFKKLKKRTPIGVKKEPGQREINEHIDLFNI